MKIITFEYRNKIQARWLKYMSYLTGRDIVELALEFGESLAIKINFKYQLLVRGSTLLKEITTGNKITHLEYNHN